MTRSQHRKGSSGRRTRLKRPVAAVSVCASMSGFGSGSASDRHFAALVDIRSLNSRFFDCSVRLPSSVPASVEALVRERLERVLKRGRIEATFTITPSSSSGVNAVFREDLFVRTFQQLRRSKPLAASLSEQDVALLLMNRKEIFEIVRDDGTLQPSEKLMLTALDAAIAQLVAMRVSEGARLAHDLSARLDELAAIQQRILALTRQQAPRFKEELIQRIEMLATKAGLDAQRLEQEVAILVQRADVHEELVRLGSHLTEFRRLMTEDAPGKRLEFLTQEFLRELNTIGSKIALAEAQHLVVAGKGAVERIKEQVQNIA